MTNTEKEISQVEWKNVNWAKVEGTIFKLQKRIYRASENRNVKLVRRVQKMIVNSWSAKLLAVRKVTQENKGKCTAGVDRVKSLNNRQRVKLAQELNLDGKSRATRRVWIPKPGKKEERPLGIPSWSDKLLQEVIRSLLEAYYEPQFSEHSHGFRPQRGCHTALREITQKGRATKWFIEGDIRACFDSIDHHLLLEILQEKIHDNRFIRLIKGLLKAGYLENWQYNSTYSGVPQGTVVSPILSNLVLDKLDKYIEQELIPAYTRGQRRRVYPPYRELTKAKTTCQKIYQQYRSTIETKDGTYKVLQVTVERDNNKPLITYFGGVSLRWNKWVKINDNRENLIWNGRSEIVERLLAQKCALCGATDNIEVHHIRKLADIQPKGRKQRPEWMKKMLARKRKTLVVCRQCHEKIQYGRYDGNTLKRKKYGQAT